MRYGPIRDAPNPIQRAIQSSPLVGMISLGQFFGSWVSAFIVVSGTSAVWVLVNHATWFVASVIFCWLLRLNQRITQHEIDETIVPYLRWPRWMPGFIDTDEGEEQVVDGDLETPPTVAVVSNRATVGPACESPNPFQRWNVAHPYLVRAVVVGWLIGLPARQLLGLADMGVVVILVFAVSALAYWRSSKRAPADEDRAQRQIVYLPWPRWVPGSRPMRVGTKET